MTIINENLRTLDDPEAKAALIWIIGEYSDRIEGAENQLIKFIDNLKEEPYIIQINILDSATKTFLKCQSEESYNILNQVSYLRNRVSYFFTIKGVIFNVFLQEIKILDNFS